MGATGSVAPLRGCLHCPQVVRSIVTRPEDWMVFGRASAESVSDARFRVRCVSGSRCGLERGIESEMPQPHESSMALRWDPRIMIRPPYVPCPACGESAFGTLSISNNHWIRRCRSCNHTGTTRLPSLQKRLIYVDQMVLSNIAKALDPVWRETRGEQDSFWVELFKGLERLVKMQLAVCVESPIHDQESAVTPYAATLRRLREYLSEKVEFHSPIVVLQHQLHNALRSVEANVPVTLDTYLGAGARDVTDGRLDQWADRLQISVNFARSGDDIESYRRSRDQAGNAMEHIWARWATQSGRRFQDWYDEERRSLYPTWTGLHRQHVLRMERYTYGTQRPEDMEDIINPGMAVMVVFGLLHHFKEAGCSVTQAHERLQTFFSSEAALQAPANDISSLLFAALARKAAAGQKKVPNRGTPNDINAISSYLPYCQALFVDDQFAGLLREKPLVTQLQRYGASVYSNNSRDAFLTFLKQVESDAPPDHVARVIEVYGEDWLTSFDSILADERARRAPRNT
ncbi:MAG: hypothetical protein JWM95_723 [Gemmatimonadetes bacterium]|nr:hypothetical protein [Gemmatimonadota bacterium]